MHSSSQKLAPYKSAQREIESAFAAMTPWAREHFGLSHHWQPHLRIFCDPRIPVSKGGWFAVRSPVNRTHSQVLAVSINVCHHTFPTGLFWEYPHYANDEEIGSFSDHWQRQLWALVAHELAHAVEYADVDLKMISDTWEARSAKHQWRMMNRGDHSDRFQWIYRRLRRTWVNNGAWRGKDELAVAAHEMESNTNALPTVIRVFAGLWATGGFASGKFETVGAFDGGFRVKTPQGVRDLMVQAPNWVAV